MSFAALLPTPQTEVMAPQTVTEEDAPPPCYVLRTDRGEVCIFEGDTLLRRTGVAVSSLPAEDRESLSIGIAASSQEALSSLLEDLCS